MSPAKPKMSAARKHLRTSCGEAAQDALDVGVRITYVMGPKEDPLTFLLTLNEETATYEAEGPKMVSPGLPPSVQYAQPLVSIDRIIIAGWKEF